MPIVRQQIVRLATAMWLLAVCAAHAGDTPTFEADVQPIFAAHCVRCHDDETQKAELNLNTAAGLRRGGESGESLLAKEPDGNLLFELVANRLPDRVEVIADEIDILCRGVMGLTMQCARCHSHKYDPIPHRDYYRFVAIFKGAYDEYEWMIERGVRFVQLFPQGGTIYGNTDDIGYASVEDRVSIQDWHATILHLLGLHHEELFFERNGLNERLTHQFETRVVREIIA